MHKTSQVNWSSNCFLAYFWCVKDFKIFCMKVLVVETDSAFTFPIVGTGVQRTWKVLSMPQEMFFYVLAESHCTGLLSIF